jgi:hypothetical protein
MIGGASLLRGIPGLPTLLWRFMPANKAVPAFDRTWLALVPTCQVFVGAFLGITAQFVLAFGIIFYVLPWMGLELLDTAHAVAEFDLPIRVLRVWWGDRLDVLQQPHLDQMAVYGHGAGLAGLNRSRLGRDAEHRVFSAAQRPLRI